METQWGAPLQAWENQSKSGFVKVMISARCEGALRRELVVRGGISTGTRLPPIPRGASSRRGPALAFAGVSTRKGRRFRSPRGGRQGSRASCKGPCPRRGRPKLGNAPAVAAGGPEPRWEEGWLREPQARDARGGRPRAGGEQEGAPRGQPGGAGWELGVCERLARRHARVRDRGGRAEGGRGRRGAVGARGGGTGGTRGARSCGARGAGAGRGRVPPAAPPAGSGERARARAGPPRVSSPPLPPEGNGPRLPSRPAGGAGSPGGDGGPRGSGGAVPPPRSRAVAAVAEEGGRSPGPRGPGRSRGCHPAGNEGKCGGRLLARTARRTAGRENGHGPPLRSPLPGCPSFLLLQPLNELLRGWGRLVPPQPLPETPELPSHPAPSPSAPRVSHAAWDVLRQAVRALAQVGSVAGTGGLSLREKTLLTDVRSATALK